MYLEKISIYGFKTFRSETEIALSPKITCIVGPNGSGKSNVVDAIRWALGEQRLSLLRASDSTDLIFSGSAFKKPLNVASVKLIFNNEDRAFTNVNTPRVIVERRIYRSKESGYFVNNNPIRLQDVLSLFYSAKMYNHMYSIVSQGRVDEILLAKPEQKRMLIEQVAGVEVFKKKKREAEKKLQETEQNLLRVKDALSELRKHAERIVREAKKAHMYYFLNDRLKQLESTLLNYSITNLKREIETIKSGIKDTENEESTIIEKLRNKKADFYKENKTKNEILEKLENLRRKREEISIQEAKIEEKENYLTEERNRLEKKIRELDLIIESNTRKVKYIQEDLNKITENKKELQENVLKNEKEVESIKRKIATIEEEIKPLLEKEKEQKKNRQKLQEERIKKERILSSVQSETAYLNREKSKIELIIKNAENIETKDPSLFENEINSFNEEISKMEKESAELSGEIALLKYQIKEAEQFINQHKTNKKQFKEGTLGHLIGTQKIGVGLEEEFNAFIMNNEEEIKTKNKGHYFIKAHLIEFKNKRTENILPITYAIDSPYLQGIYIAETINDAIVFFKENIENIFIKKIITKDGFVLYSPFEVKINSNLLVEEKEKLIEKLSEEKQAKEKRQLEIQNHMKSLKESIKNLQKKMEIEKQKIADKNKALMQKGRIAEIEEKLQRNGELSKKIQSEIENLINEMRIIEQDNVLSEKKKVLEDLKATLHNKLMSLKDAQYRLDAADKEAKQLKARIEGTNKNIKRLKAEKEEEKEKLNKLEENAHNSEKLHNKIRLDLAEIKEKEKELKEKLLDVESEIRRLNVEIARLEEQKENILKRMEKQRITLAEKNVQMENIKNAMREKDIKEREILYKVDVKKIRIEIASLKSKIQSLGAIDFTSVDQEEDIKNELQNKESIYNDVLSSKKELETFIKEMDKKAHEEFQKTLEGVEKYFSAFFRRMFKGGEATIQRMLDENGDVKGIELNVRLPGKKKQSLPLLSGGEKSLTALAFLFAIFKVKPAPFYVLDEVDAALDEENVVKFGELLAEESDFSQFIVITHNKETMQRAHLLYGITMEENGVSKVVSLKLV